MTITDDEVVYVTIKSNPFMVNDSEFKGALKQDKIALCENGSIWKRLAHWFISSIADILAVLYSDILKIDPVNHLCRQEIDSF